MKTIITALFIIAIIFIWFPQPKINLEIYTPENIYYINGLTVTNEVNEETKTFETPEDLNIYISNVTANDTQKCNNQ